MVNERSQTQKATYSMIPLMWNSKKEKNLRQKSYQWSSEAEVGVRDWLQIGVRKRFGKHSVFQLCYSFVKTHLMVYLKGIYFVACKWHFNRYYF